MLQVFKHVARPSCIALTQLPIDWANLSLPIRHKELLGPSFLRPALNRISAARIRGAMRLLGRPISLHRQVPRRRRLSNRDDVESSLIAPKGHLYRAGMLGATQCRRFVDVDVAVVRLRCSRLTVMVPLIQGDRHEAKHFRPGRSIEISERKHIQGASNELTDALFAWYQSSRTFQLRHSRC